MSLTSGLWDEMTRGAHDRDGDVPVPDVRGPVGGGTPVTGAVVDLEAYGYTETEYFLSGEARPLGPENPYPVEDREDPPSEPAAYTTRLLVYRPAEPADANGTALVEWPNVSTGRDLPVTWVNTFEYAMAEGYVLAVASAQKVGVDDSHTDGDLRTTDPDRYDDLHHPGDAYSYDVFSQAIAALSRTPRPDPDPLAGLSIDRVLATGMSQSAQYLRYYVNEVQPDGGLVDGFLPTVTMRTPVEDADIRDDLVPVMWVMSEDEAGIERRRDSGQFRLWEVAGTSHINYWLSAWGEATARRDFMDEDPAWGPEQAGQYGERRDGVYGECEYNYFPMRFAYRAALAHLDDWVRGDGPPPTAPRIRREDGEVATDDDGNVIGGLRLPPIDVPVASYDARSCGQRGRTDRFDEATLDELYPTNTHYVEAMRAATDAAVERGHLLPMDAEELVDRAADSPVGGDRNGS